jgi:hypothetical protein
MLKSHLPKQKAHRLCVKLITDGIRRLIPEHQLCCILCLLSQMGVLTKAQYLSANSGGGWVTTPYSYSSERALASFFGPYVDPANLTVAKLTSSHTAGSWGKEVSGRTLVPGLLSNPGEQSASVYHTMTRLSSHGQQMIYCSCLLLTQQHASGAGFCGSEAACRRATRGV